MSKIRNLCDAIHSDVLLFPKLLLGCMCQMQARFVSAIIQSRFNTTYTHIHFYYLAENESLTQ